MGKHLLIARSNLRRAKGQAVTIVVLMLIAAVMLNLWLMLAIDYKANFDRCHNRLNDSHVTLAADNGSPEFRAFLTETIGEDERTAQFRLDSCLYALSIFDYNGGRTNAYSAFLDKDTALTRAIGKAEIVEEGEYTSGIYLPLLYQSEEAAVGKPFTVTVGASEITYTICGFFNSAMLGSHNCVVMEFILTQDKYEELEALGYAPQATLCSVRLNDRAECQTFEADLKTAVSGQFPGVQAMSNSYAMVSQSRYAAQMICSSIVSAMAFFVLLITLIVIVSNIINYIQVNMKDLGALKAVGYTSGQLSGVLLLQFLGLTLLAAVCGTALSYTLFPGVSAMMAMQTGIPYTVRFLPLPFGLTLAILCGAVALVVGLASRRIRKIEPITALRSGLSTHNFKCNHIPLDKANVPLNCALALKTTLSGVKQNITVCATMLVLSLVVVFSGLMLENMIWDSEPFVQLIAGETADSLIGVHADSEEEFLAEARADSRVEKVYLYHSISVWHVGGVELLATICDDFAQVNNQSVVFDGRFPKFDNEIAIAAKYAREQGFRIGDEIEITSNGRSECYLITGFTQVTNYLGKDCLLTRAGYERLGELDSANYFIDLTDGADIDGFNEDIAARCAGVTAVLNFQAAEDAVLAVYVMLMTIIVIAIFVLSAVIIVFVLYLLVRTMLNQKNRDYGILKALGFTTGQLILQTALSFMPTVLLSTAFGLTVCGFLINPLMALFLSGLGIAKCSFPIPVDFITAAGAVLVLFAFGILCLLSLKIKRITPKALLSGE